MASARSASVKTGRCGPLLTNRSGVTVTIFEGLEELPGKSHYLTGSDPKQWRRDIPNYARVAYRGVYPGIDLIYYGNQGRLEYDFVVAPGADPSRIRLRFRGADRANIDDDGNLVLRMGGSEVVQHAPVVYQEINGRRKSVAGRYDLAWGSNLTPRPPLHPWRGGVAVATGRGRHHAQSICKSS